MYNIHCMNNISHYGTDLLTDDYALCDSLDEATGILVRSAAMHDVVFPESLLAIARAGAGVNNIPLDRCAEEGIVVFNTPGANANAVKELVICGMLMCCRDLIGSIAWARENAEDPDIAKTTESAKKAFAGTEIIGKKLGVVGLGAIGALVANAAIDLGMEVYGYDPYLSVNAAWKISSKVRHVTNVDDIYRDCDFITIHVPAMESTNGMVDAHAFSLMKPNAVVLNFSRDTLVDVPAIGEALASKKIAKYITDFPTPEVMKLENTIVISHLGASTEEAEDNCAIMAARQIMDYIENGNIVNSVNYPMCSLGKAAGNGSRIAILHANVPNMISQITTILGATGANIANLQNGSRGNHAYTLIDLDAPASDEEVAQLAAIGDIRRVRVL